MSQRTFLEIYQQLIAEDKLIVDNAQVAALGPLEAFKERLEASEGQSSGLTRIFGRRKSAPINGLYLWGKVGRGKSFLMDLFFHHLDFQHKSKFHFLAFMQRVHEHLRILHQQEVEDVIPPLAQALTGEIKLLCLDEMQIDNVPDGVILGRLFEHFFSNGIAIFTTSNRHPDELFKDGLNRHLIEPYIDSMKANMEIHEFGEGQDHRINRLKDKQTYFYPANEEAARKIDQIWRDLSGGESETLKVEFMGREIVFANFAKGVLRTQFWDLCGQPLGPPDFIAITQAIRVLILEDVPQLSSENYNEAKRFVMLIDALYENQIKLILSAATQPENLYLEGTGSFEFNRAVSRLNEMQSADWVNQ